MTISDDIVTKALMIACSTAHVGAGDGATYVVTTPTLATMRAALEAVMPDITPAAADALAERRRQVEVEGWDAAHDDAHGNGEIAVAAASYAWAAALLPTVRHTLDRDGWFGSVVLCRLWRWDHKWWKPTTPRRDLVKAASLILAEIERLDRASEKETKP